MRKANTINGKKKVVRKGKAAKKRFHIGKPTGRVSGIQRLEKVNGKVRSGRHVAWGST
jgi:hypothetical protein